VHGGGGREISTLSMRQRGCPKKCGGGGASAHHMTPQIKDRKDLGQGTPKDGSGLGGRKRGHDNCQGHRQGSKGV